jgi:hypothetical protein
VNGHCPACGRTGNAAKSKAPTGADLWSTRSIYISEAIKEGSKKRACEECGEEFVLAPNKPGCADRCPQYSGPLPSSNEDPKRIFRRKRMFELAKESDWSKSAIEKIIDDQWLEDHVIEPTDQNSK